MTASSFCWSKRMTSLTSLRHESQSFNFMMFYSCCKGTKNPERFINKLEAQWAEPVSLTFHSVLRKLYTEPSIGASYQISVHLATRFQRRIFFRNQPIRNKNCLWWPCLLTDQDDISNFYRGPSIDASYKVLIHLAKQFQRRRFLKTWPIRNKNCQCPPCLLTNRTEISNLYRGPSIDTSYQVSVHFGKAFSEKKIFRNRPI